MSAINQLIMVLARTQMMQCYEKDRLFKTYRVSTGKNGLGEEEGGGCTPRGWHQIHNIIGLEHTINSVFISRQWTGEIYNQELAHRYPGRDWIISRILQLDGLEPGRNRGGNLDSLQRFIYIHGTPDTTPLGIPSSHGCIRMGNKDVIELANWAKIDARVYIE